jgi:uncharacterized membrane protein
MDPVSPPPVPYSGPPPNPPGAVGALVCGILAIVFCWFPFAGLPLGIIALVLAIKAKKAVSQNPGKFAPGGMRTAGFVLGIIGTVFSAIYLVVWILAITVVSKTPGLLEDINRQMREEQERQQRMHEGR